MVCRSWYIHKFC